MTTTLMKKSGEANVFSPLPSLRTFFDDPFRRNCWFSWDNENGEEDYTLPAVNISETENSYELSLAAPGMSKNDFSIEIQENHLVISGQKKEEKESKNSHNCLRQEYNYSSFTRTFTLAEKRVKAEDITARYVDGILYISIPKSPEAKKRTPKVVQIS